MIGKKKIVIAEDDPTLMKALSLILDEEFEIYKAVNGKVAWDYIKKNQIDCLITDIDMPDMNGLELIKKMRKSGNNTNVIVTTGSVSAGLKEECKNLGVIDFLIKPYNMFGLKKIINACEEPFIVQ